MTAFKCLNKKMLRHPFLATTKQWVWPTPACSKVACFSWHSEIPDTRDLARSLCCWCIFCLSLFLIYVAQGCGYDYFWKLQKSFKADTPTFVSPGLCHVKSMYSLVTIGIKAAPINTFPDAIRIREVFGWTPSRQCLSWPELVPD